MSTYSLILISLITLVEIVKSNMKYRAIKCLGTFFFFRCSWSSHSSPRWVTQQEVSRGKWIDASAGGKEHNQVRSWPTQKPLMSHRKIQVARAKRWVPERDDDGWAQVACWHPWKGKRDSQQHRGHWEGGLPDRRSSGACLFQEVSHVWRRILKDERVVSVPFSTSSLQLKLPVISGRSFAFSWPIYSHE